jgi:Family of unknown function (DUF5999)
MLDSVWTIPEDRRCAMCPHHPQCPSADAADRYAARVVADHEAEQGWSLLCNGVVLFEDTGALLPGGRVIASHRPTPVRLLAAA